MAWLNQKRHEKRQQSTSSPKHLKRRSLFSASKLAISQQDKLQEINRNYPAATSTAIRTDSLKRVINTTIVTNFSKEKLWLYNLCEYV